jgi:hypothetical protein
MEQTPDDKMVVDLLSKLKNSNGTYPADLLASRRQRFTQQVANAALGIGVGSQVRKSMKGGNGSGVAATSAASKVVEFVLIAAIAIEAGTAVYLYRDKIAEFIRSYTTPNVQQVGPLPDDNSVENPTFGNDLQTPSADASETPAGTPATSVVGDNNGSSDTDVIATPNPNDGKGNQYGLTPKPERTKTNDDNKNDNNKNNEDKSGGNK